MVRLFRWKRCVRARALCVRVFSVRVCQFRSVVVIVISSSLLFVLFLIFLACWVAFLLESTSVDLTGVPFFMLF